MNEPAVTPSSAQDLANNNNLLTLSLLDYLFALHSFFPAKVRSCLLFVELLKNFIFDFFLERLFFFFSLSYLPSRKKIKKHFFCMK